MILLKEVFTLMQNFSNILMKNEDQYEYVLHVVEQHRQNWPH